MYCATALGSNVAIPELPAVGHRKWGIVLRMQEGEPQAMTLPWVHHWLSPRGEKLVSYAREGRGHRLRFPGLADFRISASATRVYCFPVPGIPEETLRHLLIDQVLPRCLAHTGELVLHASAVVLDQEALLFIGESQSGKSTLAGSFHQAGYPAVSDDIVLLKVGRSGVRAIPSYGGLRLWQDSLSFLFSDTQDTQSMAHYSDKKRILFGERQAQEFNKGIPILAVIVLAPSDQRAPKEMGLSHLPLRHAYMHLQKQSFVLTTGTRQKISQHMRSLGRIVHRLPVLRLSMPRDYGSLPAARTMILEHVT